MLQTLDSLTKLGIVALPVHFALMVGDVVLSIDAATNQLSNSWSEVLGVNVPPQIALTRP